MHSEKNIKEKIVKCYLEKDIKHIISKVSEKDILLYEKLVEFDNQCADKRKVLLEQIDEDAKNSFYEMGENDAYVENIKDFIEKDDDK